MDLFIKRINISTTRDRALTSLLMVVVEYLYS
jgi:hypothetical protein